MSEHITLKLENGSTNIYIGGEFFQQCKKLILSIDSNNIESFNDFKSMDEIAEAGNIMQMDTEIVNIPPEEEFWGHCSNLQVWHESGYNTDILDSKLSFPLLRRLVDVGDSKARNALKGEILHKINQGNENVVLFLFENHYFEYFSQEELFLIYEGNLSKYKASSLFLSFLQALSLQGLLAARKHYRKLVKELMITKSYNEKKNLLMKHGDILSEEDLLTLLNFLKSDRSIDYEEGIRFDIMDNIIYELEFQYGHIFTISEIVKMLLNDKEQVDFIKITAASKFPYIKLDFQADEVRRRYWEKKLYFEFSEGHVVSIEILNDLDGIESFHSNLERLKTFTELKHLHIVILGESKIDFRERLVGLSPLEELRIYRF